MFNNLLSKIYFLSFFHIFLFIVKKMCTLKYKKLPCDVFSKIQRKNETKVHIRDKQQM